jgi:hypothetical protein
MSTRKMVLSVAFALTAFAAHSLQAAIVQLHLDYVSSFDASFAPTSYSLTQAAPFQPGVIKPTDIHQFALSFNIIGQAADESIQYLQLSVNKTNMVPGFGSGGPSYAGVTPPNWDPNGPLPPGNRGLIGTNADAGSSAFDLDDIRIIFDGSNESLASHQYNPGEVGSSQPSPFKVGDVFLSLPNGGQPGTATVKLDPDNVGGAFLMWKGGTPTSNTGAVAINYTEAGANSGALASAPFVVTVVPEPASMVMMGFGALGLAYLARRRRS